VYNSDFIENDFAGNTNDWYGSNSTELDWFSLSEEDCQKNNGTLFGTGCNTPRYVPDVFFFSCLLFISTFVLAMSLKFFRNTRFFPNQVGSFILSAVVF
jgi:HCO3- transporter family